MAKGSVKEWKTDTSTVEKWTVITDDLEKAFSTVPASERILLLPQCPRPSKTCPGKFDREGLRCPEDCTEDCAIRRLTAEASRLGYKGVCVAAGGAMAVRFVTKHNPKAIVAVACYRELEQGLEAVSGIGGEMNEMPLGIVVPLTTDGCVDTQVDEAEVVRAINLGLSPERGGGPEVAARRE